MLSADGYKHVSVEIQFKLDLKSFIHISTLQLKTEILPVDSYPIVVAL